MLSTSRRLLCIIGNHHQFAQRQLSSAFRVWNESSLSLMHSHILSSNRSLVDRNDSYYDCYYYYARRFFADGSGYDHRDRTYYKNQKRTPNEASPFEVLGITKEEESYANVKKAFLKIAMQHHPDTTAHSALSEQEKQASKELFMSCRAAFEALTKGPNGIAILAKGDADSWNDHDLDEWFRDETGYDMPFMDAATMKEVAEMTETAGSVGLDRDGGMWTLARMVTENVKSGGNAQDVLRLEAGSVRDRAIDGVLRRKRKR